MKKDKDGYIVLFDAPKQEPPEFRLYYDESGKVITYTCQKLEGNFILIDASTFAQARPDVRVVDGKITTVQPNTVVSKLMPCDTGKSCVRQDISIIADDKYSRDITHWRLITYEL